MNRPTRTAIRQAADAAAALATRRRLRPVDYIRWLPLQYAFLRSKHRVKQIRAGNQGIGKTTPALAEVIGRCIGAHPLGSEGPPIAPPPIEAWIVCASWSQSLGIQKKLWALLPKDLLDPRTEYDTAAGFTPLKSPCIRFANGSLIRIKTTGQDALDFAGATLDVILFDEPPREQRMFTEALMRVQERGGVLLLSYTPINADTKYLEDLVAEGQLEDHHSRLTPESLIPIGATVPLRDAAGRLKDAAYIAEREAQVGEAEREVVVHGEYDHGSAEKYYFAAVWAPATMVFEAVPKDTDALVLGIDHGDRPGKQYAALMAVDEADLRVHVLDEYFDEKGTATPRDDALGILAMLARNAVAWHELRRAAGDRVHLPGNLRQKSNDDLMMHLAKEIGVASPRLRPQVETVKRGEGHGSGSLRLGMRWLHALMSAGRFGVNPRCRRLRGAAPKVQMIESIAKDPWDGVRYGLDPWIFALDPVRFAKGPTIRLR